MSFTQVTINNQDVTQYVTKIGNLREYNDESVHFTGVFRRGNLSISLDNTNNKFNKEGVVFNGERNEANVKLIYNSSDPNLNKYIIFSGVIDEGSTENNLDIKSINFTILDYLKLLDSSVIKIGDQARIDALYRTLRGGSSRLNKHFIACFLYFFLSKDNNKLNKIFNVFTNNELKSGSYPTINSTIESIFPPSDSYYNANNVSALDVLSDLCQANNSYLYVENILDITKLFIKARPMNTQSKKTIRESNIISFSNQTDGYNKLYNSITINGSNAYVRQDSIDKYGVRVTNISSYAPASQALANTYLDYYENPKSEVDFKVKMNNEMLDIKIGDIIVINLISRPDLKVQGIRGNYFVLSRLINFQEETIILRLRSV